MVHPTLYLASASPRRAELLRQIGMEFRTLVVDLDENLLPDEDPEAYVCRLARAKAKAAQAMIEGEVLTLGADTTVVVDGRVLGKPCDREDAVQTLLMLSGRRHEVLTAIALCDGQRCETALSRSSVEFVNLDREQCLRYWETGEPHDKAGSYAIQGLAAVWVRELQGSYSGVMGLPLHETAELLARFGITII